LQRNAASENHDPAIADRWTIPERRPPIEDQSNDKTVWRWKSPLRAAFAILSSHLGTDPTVHKEHERASVILTR